MPGPGGAGTVLVGQKKGEEMEEMKNAGPKMQVTKENIFSIISYVGVLCLVPILMKKEDPFTKFHARQGLMLFIIEIGLMIIGIIPFLGAVISQIGMLACLVVSIMGIIKVLKAEQWKIPYVGDWAEKLINI